MKKLLLGLALASLSLVGCTTTSVGESTKIDNQAMFAAEAAYNVPAQAYVAADANDKLSPAVKATVKPVLVDAYGYLLIARCAYNFVNFGKFQPLPVGKSCPANATNVAAFKAATASVESLSKKASSLLPK